MKTKSFKFTGLFLGIRFLSTPRGFVDVFLSINISVLTPKVTLAPWIGVLVFLSCNLPVILYSCNIGI